VTGTQKALTAAGIATAILYALTRTKAGQEVTADALENIIAGGAAVAGALLPRGIRNNNPGNIEWIAEAAKRWRGMISSDGRFGIFDKPENGVRAIGKELLLDESRGIRTVRGLISNWAPSHENNTAAYIVAVKTALGVAADEPISVRDRLPDLVGAIVKHENGIQPYTERELRAWVYLA
jgi:hypothetical protein